MSPYQLLMPTIQ